MALKTFAHSSATITRTGSTSTTYSEIPSLAWSLPANIRITRCYWKWTVSRSKGSTYARWYQGGTSNSGHTGVNGTFEFDVALVSGTSGTQTDIYLGAQNGTATYTEISFNVEFEYLQSSFTLSTTNVNAGETITANIAIQDSTATHKATWQFGTRASTTTTAAGVTANSFTVPLAWLDQIPSAVSGLASCTLETINSAGASVGSHILYFNILAPSNVVPSVTSLTATRVNNSVPSAWGVYVQGQSGVTAKATAAGAYGSTITGYTLTGDGKTASAATLSIAKLSGSGTLTFKATVVDSRGRSASKTLTISVVAWSSPTIKTLSVGRCNADGSANPAGSSILVSLTGAISSVSSKNTATVTVKYRAQGATTWLSGATGTSVSGSWVIAADAALPTNAYDVQAVLTDAFTSATQTALLPTAECYLDKMPGRKRLGIGGYNATDKSLYINPEWGIHWGEKHITDAPRNLLDNSDFSNPVNQRGVTTLTASGNQYTIDRWRMDSGKTFTLNDGSITISGAWLMQFVPEAVKEKTYTMAACLEDGTIVAESATPLSKHRGTYFGIDYVSTNNRVYVGLIKAGTYRWATLYEGSYTADTLPEYVPKGYAAELLECQRYYQYFPRVLVSSINSGIGAPARDYLHLPIAMRITPTITTAVVSGIAPASVHAPDTKTIDIQASTDDYSDFAMALSADL